VTNINPVYRTLLATTPLVNINEHVAGSFYADGNSAVLYVEITVAPAGDLVISADIDGAGGWYRHPTTWTVSGGLVGRHILVLTGLEAKIGDKVQLSYAAAAGAGGSIQIDLVSYESAGGASAGGGGGAASTVTFGAGVVDATTQRVTTATDDVVSTSLVSIEAVETDVYDAINHAKRVAQVDGVDDAWDGSQELVITAGNMPTSGDAIDTYIDVRGRSNLTLQWILGAGSDTTFAITIGGTCMNTGAAPSALTYHDITEHAFVNLQTGGAAASYTANAIVDLYRGRFSYIKVSITPTWGTDDGTIGLYSMKSAL
jgi:hypothetical protein